MINLGLSAAARAIIRKRREQTDRQKKSKGLKGAVEGVVRGLKKSGARGAVTPQDRKYNTKGSDYKPGQGFKGGLKKEY
jgi:hypothetical protein